MMKNKESKTRSGKKKTPASSSRSKKWSGKVTQTSDALDLENGVFKGSDPKKIAASLKHSALHSHRRKASPFQSAMSMLNFYINRGGKNLSQSKKKVLEKSKTELRKEFGKEDK
ncbi:MAG TPA: DUF3175 domain-containing protein [Puia sp.]|nr:DUF3175 domain-containing protein [Puia sp.]